MSDLVRKTIKQTINTDGIDYTGNIKKYSKIDGKPHALVNYDPVYIPLDYVCTEGVTLEETPRDPKIKTIGELAQEAAERKRNGTDFKYGCPYCDNVISVRADTARRHINGRKGDKKYICKERIAAEPDVSKKATKDIVQVFYD
uniref:Uncharacterized protein n=1 Tax=Tetranychus urticae TaxID=32264 RepID=T1JTH0_TETUR